MDKDDTISGNLSVVLGFQSKKNKLQNSHGVRWELQ